MSEALLSEKANDFINKTDEPPSWLIELCKAPIGKALFMYILKDPVLHESLQNGDYNGLVEFFISTLIVNSTNVCKELKDIDLTCCTLATSILFFEQIIKQFERATSYDECDEIINSFVKDYEFSSPEEVVIFLNYVVEVEKMCENSNIIALMETLIERTFAIVCQRHAVTPVLDISVNDD